MWRWRRRRTARSRAQYLWRMSGAMHSRNWNVSYLRRDHQSGNECHHEQRLLAGQGHSLSDASAEREQPHRARGAARGDPGAGRSGRETCLALPRFRVLREVGQGPLDGLTNKLGELKGAVATAGGNRRVSPRRHYQRHRPLKAETRVRIPLGVSSRSCAQFSSEQAHGTQTSGRAKSRLMRIWQSGLKPSKSRSNRGSESARCDARADRIARACSRVALWSGLPVRWAAMRTGELRVGRA
jgi:hypothetical protein